LIDGAGYAGVVSQSRARAVYAGSDSTYVYLSSEKNTSQTHSHADALHVGNLVSAV